MSHLLVGSGPWSLPHHKAFGWNALLIHGSSAASRGPHVRHLCLILCYICHLEVAQTKCTSVNKKVNHLHHLPDSKWR